MKAVVTLILFAAASFLAKGQSESLHKKLDDLLEGSVPMINCVEAKQLIESTENIVIFDTRSTKEYKVSSLKDAIHIDYEHFSPSEFDMPSKQDTLLFYCSVGYRSEQIAAEFKSLGYKNVFNLYGGIFEWVNSGYPIYRNNTVHTDSVHTYNEEWSKWLLKGIKVYE